MQSDPLKRRDFNSLFFNALRFSALVGRRGSVAAWNARAATATPLIRYLDPGWPDARSGVFPRLLGSLLLSGAMALSAAAQNAPGVTDREIKIGQTMPYTGPGARFSANGLAEMAYMKMINDQGGINGRIRSLRYFATESWVVVPIEPKTKATCSTSISLRVSFPVRHGMKPSSTLIRLILRPLMPP